MDKSWIGAVDRLSDEYAVRVAKFLEFSFLGKARGSRICCPFSKCQNQFSKTREDVMLHCLRDRFDHTYTSWTCHGEMYIPLHISEDHEFSTNAHGDDIASMLRDAMGIPNKDDHVENDQHLNGADAEIKRTGRTSFAIMEQEMMMKGTDPSTLDIWLESRSRGRGIEDDDTLDLHVSLFLGLCGLVRHVDSIRST
ncbi:UNVERIFIED_CONTAM: hypothetical protein Sradi_0174900 [Sesamum radiatum]|uniref:Transposase-associated domain-containing protein n=1 Tax=Sesamum radiatum TaxID=300843 RepID=A0AAW2W3I1_SESRA